MTPGWGAGVTPREGHQGDPRGGGPDPWGGGRGDPGAVSRASRTEGTPPDARWQGHQVEEPPGLQSGAFRQEDWVRPGKDPAQQSGRDGHRVLA